MLCILLSVSRVDGDGDGEEEEDAGGEGDGDDILLRFISSSIRLKMASSSGESEWDTVGSSSVIDTSDDAEGGEGESSECEGKRDGEGEGDVSLPLFFCSFLDGICCWDDPPAIIAALASAAADL